MALEVSAALVSPKQSRIERRLAAVLAADVAGFSRLMGLDEEATHIQLKNHLRTLVDPAIVEHRGRIVKKTGDGVVAEFNSVVDAVRCAVDIQRGMGQRNSDARQEQRIQFRIGINVGDIIIDDGDVFGDTVNIAGRLERFADPGGICLSEDAHRQLRGKVELAFEYIGEQKLKNIAEPVRVYRVIHSDAQLTTRSALVVPDKPSVAVLAFQNMSGGSEQDYFGDGIVEESTTALSRLKNLFVIARNSSFAYRGRAVDIKQVGRELGVRYILEGSVRKSAERVRITAQLIDAATGMHLWADRFDGGLEDIFDLQDEVTAKVVGAIAPRLEQAEIARAKRKPTENLDAYDYYLRGVASLHQGSRKANIEAVRLFLKAIQLDPDFASAYGLAAWSYGWRKANGWMANRQSEIAETARLARRAAQLGTDDAVALSFGGFALAWVVGDFNHGKCMIDRALELNPNLATAWLLSGWLEVYLGKPESAIEHLMQAMRLSPLDPLAFQMRSVIGAAHFVAGRYDEASAWAEKALREQPNWAGAARVMVASSALGGQWERAKRAMELLHQLDPTLRVSNLRDVVPFQRPEDLARYAEGLRKAGLPT